MQRRLLGALENALNPLSYLNGSISSLNKDLIPEAAGGFVTVQRWAFDVLYTLNPSRGELQGAFLTNLYKAFTLAGLKQGRGVSNWLFRIPSAQNQQHPRLVVRDQSGDQVYMLRDFLAFMNGSGDLAQGIKFFGYVLSIIPVDIVFVTPFNRYMVQNRLPVDPAVLCTIVERLFGLTIMTARHRGLGSLHGVLLPRTWILALWEDFLKFKDGSLAPLSDLNLATEKLLVDIYTGEYQKHAVMDPRNYSKFYWLYYEHRVTFCSAAGLGEQGPQLFQRYSIILHTGSVCRPDVSALFLGALPLLTSNVIEDADVSAFVSVRKIYYDGN